MRYIVTETDLSKYPVVLEKYIDEKTHEEKDAYVLKDGLGSWLVTAKKKSKDRIAVFEGIADVKQEVVDCLREQMVRVRPYYPWERLKSTDVVMHYMIHQFEIAEARVILDKNQQAFSYHFRTEREVPVGGIKTLLSPSEYSMTKMIKEIFYPEMLEQEKVCNIVSIQRFDGQKVTDYYVKFEN